MMKEAIEVGTKRTPISNNITIMTIIIKAKEVAEEVIHSNNSNSITRVTKVTEVAIIKIEKVIDNNKKANIQVKE